MVSCAEQYGNDYLYVYANGGSVCNDNYINHYCQSEYYPDVYGCCAHLFWCYSGSVADDFEQRHYRYLGAGFR